MAVLKIFGFEIRNFKQSSCDILERSVFTLNSIVYMRPNIYQIGAESVSHYKIQKPSFREHISQMF